MPYLYLFVNISPSSPSFMNILCIFWTVLVFSWNGGLTLDHCVQDLEKNFDEFHIQLPLPKNLDIFSLLRIFHFLVSWEIFIVYESLCCNWNGTLNIMPRWLGIWLKATIRVFCRVLTSKFQFPNFYNVFWERLTKLQINMEMYIGKLLKLNSLKIYLKPS